MENIRIHIGSFSFYNLPGFGSRIRSAGQIRSLQVSHVRQYDLQYSGGLAGRVKSLTIFEEKWNFNKKCL